MSERVSVAERANKASSAEQENGWAALVNERMSKWPYTLRVNFIVILPSK